jgi:maltose O-acetyltransferase
MSRQTIRQILRLCRRSIIVACCGWAWLRCLCTRLVLGFHRLDFVVARLGKPETAFVLRRFGAAIAGDCDIEGLLVVHHAAGNYSHLTVRSGCHVGKQVFLDLAGPIDIGPRATVSMRVMILTHTDVGRSPLAVRHFPQTVRPVRICPGAYIGAAAKILPGVTLGECAVVGAGAVVTKDVSPYTVVAGVPARPIRTLWWRPGGLPEVVTPPADSPATPAVMKL